MKKAKRWTSKPQYAAPCDKQRDQSIGAFNYRQIPRFIDLFIYMNGKQRLSEQLG